MSSSQLATARASDHALGALAADAAGELDVLGLDRVTRESIEPPAKRITRQSKGLTETSDARSQRRESRNRE